jgi:hypothetical protein
MPGHRSRQLRRANLFLVRVWARGPDDKDCNNSINGKEEWSGSVQRVVDGESYRFSGWQSLADVLDAMMSGNIPSGLRPSHADDDTRFSDK